MAPSTTYKHELNKIKAIWPIKHPNTVFPHGAKWPANEYVKDKVMRGLRKLAEVCPTLSLATCLLRWAKMERLEKNKYLLTDDALKSACILENDCRLACKAAKNPADPTLSQGGGDSESEDGSDEDDEDGELDTLGGGAGDQQPSNMTTRAWRNEYYDKLQKAHKFELTAEVREMLDMIYDMDANRYGDLANITRKAVQICCHHDRRGFQEEMEALEDSLHQSDRDAHNRVVEELHRWGIIPMGAVDFAPLRPITGTPPPDGAATEATETLQDGEQDANVSGEVDKGDGEVKEGGRGNSIKLEDD